MRSSIFSISSSNNDTKGMDSTTKGRIRQEWNSKMGVKQCGQAIAIIAAQVQLCIIV
jgi:hypothetical protein